MMARRISECDKMLEKVEEEVKLIEGWQKQAGAVGREQEECFDIKEEFEENKEKEWKEKHKDNVKKEREKGSTGVVSDEDMWRKLEELEVQEALEKEWENEDSSEEETDSEEESDLESDDEEENQVLEPSDADNDNETENDKGLSITNLGTNFNSKASKKKIGRRVSWAGIEAPDGENLGLGAGNVIKFLHSTQPPPEDTLATESDGVPHTPSDLQHYACQQPKSILKHTDAEILIREVPEQDNTIGDTELENLEPAVQDRVLERAVCDMPLANPEEPKRVSKFKAARLKGKQ